ncbi:hypothetical protein FNF27_05587 [Cafeteria roenbergensis]|nr:hypothetical protein FNF27_05587 [Cafeteria roenbergensis]
MPLEPGQRVAVGAASDLPPHLKSIGGLQGTVSQVDQAASAAAVALDDGSVHQGVPLRCLAPVTVAAPPAAAEGAPASESRSPDAPSAEGEPQAQRPAADESSESSDKDDTPGAQVPSALRSMVGEVVKVTGDSGPLSGKVGFVKAVADATGPGGGTLTVTIDGTDTAIAKKDVVRTSNARDLAALLGGIVADDPDSP